MGLADEPGTLCEVVGEPPTPTDPPVDEGLSPQQMEEVTRVVGRMIGVFSNRPGCTTRVTHAIDTPPGKVARM